MASEPLYMRIKRDLCERIESGEWTEGEYLPAEHQLIEDYQVSRTTIRKAIGDLVIEKRLVIDRGNGTRVAPRTPCENILSINAMIEADGKTPGCIRSDVTIEEADEDIATIFTLESDRRIVVLTRIHTADDIPVSVSISRFPLRLFGGMRVQMLNDDLSIYQRLIHLDHAVDAVSDRLCLDLPDPAIARSLGLQKEEKTLMIKRLAYDVSSTPIESAQIWVKSYEPTYYLRRQV